MSLYFIFCYYHTTYVFCFDLRESETSRFSEAVKNLAHSKTNPLAAIGEHLRKRLKQEEEQGPS